MTQIVTGDAVLLDLRPARIPTRILATLVDLAVMALAGLGAGYLITWGGGSPARQRGLGTLAFLVIGMAYPIAAETLSRGRTLGALTLGLRVTRDDGGAVRFRHALLRWLAFWAVDFAPWTACCAGLVAAALNPQGKRLGDLVAGTVVIRTRAPRRPAPLPVVEPALAAWATDLEMSAVGEELITAARQLLQRQQLMSAYPRDELLGDLARQVSARTAPAPPPGTSPLQFLAAVVTERRRREQHRIAGTQWVPTAAELPAGWR